MQLIYRKNAIEKILTEEKTVSNDNKRKGGKKNQPCIHISKDGPYLVSGFVPISVQTIIADEKGTAYEWKEEKKYPPKTKYALCRCGQSNNRPFCDGTHSKVTFDGTESPAKESWVERAKIFSGPTLVLSDVEDLCASARFCHRAGGIWNLIPKTSNEEKRKIVIEEVRDCPSGRLMLQDRVTHKQIEPTYSASIGIIEDPQVGVRGPIWVRGKIPIESCNGKLYEIRNRVTLCRCGKSSNKPFCDSSHYPEEHNHGEEQNKQGRC